MLIMDKSTLEHNKQEPEPAEINCPCCDNVHERTSGITMSTHDINNSINWNHLPGVILGLIESYLPASSICSLSSTSHLNHKRWTALRWKRTFHLHYGISLRIQTHTQAQAQAHIQEPSLHDSQNRNSNRHPMAGRYTHSPQTNNSPCTHHEHSCTRKSTGAKRRWEDYHIARFEGWEKSFVGCCCDQCARLDKVGQDTQFDVSSLVPSLRKAYGELWSQIELSMLGYGFGTNSAVGNTAAAGGSDINREGRFVRMTMSGILWNMVTSGLTVTSRVMRLLIEPFMEYASSFVVKPMEKQAFPTDYATKLLHVDVHSICAWKLACLLKESGVNCLRCRICDKIEIMDGRGGRKGISSMEIGKEGAWMIPCRCCGPVHRQCLEDQLGLRQKFYRWEVLKIWGASFFGRDVNHTLEGSRNNRYHRHPLRRDKVAPQIWVSYDSPFTPNSDQVNTLNPTTVNEFNQFTSPSAHCIHCGEQYERTFRLPRSISEVVFSSLSDQLALARAFSTFAHFVLCIFAIAYIEGKCDHEFCDNNITLSDRWVLLQWPHRTWKGAALAWWQLQQCCMLHILFSPRFVAIVERLWLHSISIFYVRLYIYFVLTSIVMAASFLPAVNRTVHDSIASRVPFVDRLSPIWDFIAFCNFVHYAISSTTVIAIFWRTNYRLCTISNRIENNDDQSRIRARGEGHAQHEHNMRIQHLRFRHAQTRTTPNWNEHPIYYGQWR